MADGLKLTAAIMCLAALLMAGADVDAGEAGDLYRARTIVTGQGRASRQARFAECLEQVLVKVSGDPRLAEEPAVAAIAGRADGFAVDFDYRDRMAGIPVHDEQGTRDRPYDLTVGFDPAKIDAALRSLGDEPWRAPRPRVVALLAVRLGPTSYVLASDGAHGRDQREALADAAERFGLPVTLPDEVTLAEASLSYESLPTLDPARLDATAKALGGDVALIGDMRWSEASLGWIADWRLDAQDKSHRWQIRGVGFDAAFRNAMAGVAQILSGHAKPKQHG
jgi:uncharacterized protein